MNVLEALFPWLAALLSLLWAYPWAGWLLALPAANEFPRRDRLLTLLVTIGLSLGGLTWLLMVLAAVSPGLAGFWPVTLLVLALHGGGWLVWQKKRAGLRAGLSPAPTGSRDRYRLPQIVMIALTLLIVALTLFNAAYWPFGEDDTLTLYGPISYRFATTGLWGDQGLYDAYPVLDPVLIAYLQLANGVVGLDLPHEYAASFVMAVLGLVAVGATYILGRDLYQPAVGVVAAFLLATLPILPHWAASAYTDLPAGAYYLLAMIFAWRLYRAPHPVYALLTGLMAGLAAFTKNGALLLLGVLVGWVIYTYWRPFTAQRFTAPGEVDAPILAARSGPIRGRHILWIAAAWLAAAGLWYAHALHAFGTLVPPTGWTDQAQRTLAMLVAPATTFSHFGLTGLIGLVGLGWQLVNLGRTRWAFAARTALLLGFGVPFWLVWWWLFSYDLRFLLLVWGVFAVMGGKLVMDGVDKIGRPAGRPYPVIPQIGIAVALVIVAFPAMRIAVDHKTHLARDLWLSGPERYAAQFGEQWTAIQWLRDNAPGMTVKVDDALLVYPLQSRGITTNFLTGAEPAGVRGNDYWLLSPGQELPDWLAAADVRPVLEADGYTLVELLVEAN